MRKFEKISFDEFKKDIIDDLDLYNSYSLPRRKTVASAGYDFEILEDIEIKVGEIKKIPTGIKAKFPTNEFLMLVVRSSIGFKYNIRMCNQVGIIDSDFYNNADNEGHIWFVLQNEGTQNVKLRKGESLIQGLFIKYYKCSDKVENKRNGWSGKPERKEEI